MKGLILDQGLPRAAASQLRATSVDAIHVAELGMAAASDDTILKYARDKALVVTLDADFHTQLALSGRIGSVCSSSQSARTEEHRCHRFDPIGHHKDATELEAGALVSVTKKLIRIKRLPITK